MIEMTLKEYVTALAAEPKGTLVRVYPDQRVELVPPVLPEKKMRGRPCLGDRPMTSAERQARRRALKMIGAG